LARDQPGGYLLTAQVPSGVKVARAWLRLLHGTGESVVPRGGWPVARVACGRSRERVAQVVEAARARVAMWGTEADRFVVAMKPGNAGRVKGADHPGLFGGQPRVRGRSR
jgi:hypothetical protein